MKWRTMISFFLSLVRQCCKAVSELSRKRLCRSDWVVMTWSCTPEQSTLGMDSLTLLPSRNFSALPTLATQWILLSLRPCSHGCQMGVDSTADKRKTVINRGTCKYPAKNGEKELIFFFKETARKQTSSIVIHVTERQRIQRWHQIDCKREE